MRADCTPDPTDAVVVLSLLRDEAWVVSVAIDCVCAVVVAQVYVCCEDIEGRRQNLPKVPRNGISDVKFGSFVGNAYKTSLVLHRMETGYQAEELALLEASSRH